MVIKEIHNRGAPTLHLPTLLCDETLGDIPEPFPRQSFFMLLCGSPGMGKTSFLHAILTQKKPAIYRKKFDWIFLGMPPTSIQSLGNTPFKKHPKERLITELDEDALLNVRRHCEEASKEGEHTLLILDDFTASLKDKLVEKELKRLAWNRRHLRLSIIILSQGYNAIPLPLRKVATHCVLWKPKNAREWENVFEELCWLDIDVRQELFKMVFQDKHDFLFLDVGKGLFHRNFNPLQIQE